MKKLLAGIGIVALGIAGLVYAACAPDLIVTSVSYDKFTGLFSSVVKNRGTTATAGGVNVTAVYTVGGIERATGSVAGPLAAGASVTVGSTPAYTIPIGAYTVIASVDSPTSLIAESQETNNARSKIVTVAADLSAAGTIVARVTAPLGTGSSTPEVIRDGVKPAVGSTVALTQYDTWDGANTAVDDWIGYTYASAQTFSQVSFQEGRHFADGGWFETLTVQVRQGGVWVPVTNLVITPVYPGINDNETFETYDMVFDSVSADGIRIFGNPGGTADFISVGELRVFGVAGTAPPPPPPPLTSLNVKDFGAVGNGIANDTTAIKNAFAAAFAAPAKAVRFPAGTYYLGALSGNAVVFDLSSYGDGLTFISEDAKFLVNTTTVTMPRIFYMTAQNNIDFLGNWHFEDLGGDNFYPTLIQYKGANAITVGSNSSYVHVDKLYVLNMQSGFMGLSESPFFTTHHLTLNEIHANRTMYPFTLQFQGNTSSVGTIYATNCGRPFFVYGVDGVTATVIAVNNAAGYHSFIKNYAGETRNINLTLSDTRPFGQRQQVLTISHAQAGTASVMENIDVTISLNFSDTPWVSSSIYGIVHLASYSNDIEISSATQTWRNITIRGVRGASPYLVYSGFTSLTPKGTMNLPTGTLLPPGFTNLFTVTNFIP